MELVQEILKNWQEIAAAGFVLIGAFVAFLGALYAFFLLIPGEQPDNTIKALLDFTRKYSRKSVNMVLLAGGLSMAILTSSCSGIPKTDCLRRTASSEIAVTESYQSTSALLAANVIDKDTALKAMKATDTADALVESANRLCLADEAKAGQYLAEAASLLLEANNILGE